MTGLTLATGSASAPRCAIYARYSSDQQREASIEDQLRICRARAEREGWTVVETFTDAAISGATLLRKGYQRLLEAMRDGRLDVVLAESLDRLSRDQEYIAGFYKQAGFAGVRVVTLAEGEVSELHVGLKGTMGALFLKDLADKTRRGLEGRIRAGRSAGAVAYGYRIVRQVRPDGEFERGLREADPAEATVVQRIFADYAAGHSPLAIARALNEAGVPGPGGGPWFDSTIRGRPGRDRGLLRNPIYIGQLVWNRRRSLKDPVTGAVRRRPNDPSSHVFVNVPELRLIDDALWERVQARLGAERAPRREGGASPAFWEARRPRHLLTGKVVCGTCGGLFQPRGRDYLGCKSAKRHLCRNTSTVRRGPLEARVLDALGRQLMAPDLVAEFVAEFTREWNRLAAEGVLAAAERRRALAEVERQVTNLVDAIANGLRSPGLQARLDALESRRAELAAGLAEAPARLPAMHPNLTELYRTRVGDLQAALSANRSPEALEAARELIERVVIHPPGDPGGPPGIELVGQLMAMLEAGGTAVSSAQRAFAMPVLKTFASSAKEGQGGRRPPRERPRRLRAPPGVLPADEAFEQAAEHAGALHQAVHAQRAAAGGAGRAREGRGAVLGEFGGGEAAVAVVVEAFQQEARREDAAEGAGADRAGQDVLRAAFLHRYHPGRAAHQAGDLGGGEQVVAADIALAQQRVRAGARRAGAAGRFQVLERGEEGDALAMQRGERCGRRVAAAPDQGLGLAGQAVVARLGLGLDRLEPFGGGAEHQPRCLGADAGAEGVARHIPHLGEAEQAGGGLGLDARGGAAGQHQHGGGVGAVAGKPGTAQRLRHGLRGGRRGEHAEQPERRQQAADHGTSISSPEQRSTPGRVTSVPSRNTATRSAAQASGSGASNSTISPIGSVSAPRRSSPRSPPGRPV
jgi:DNA invertase Pin-like site-specific DNA recombinase